MSERELAFSDGRSRGAGVATAARPASADLSAAIAVLRARGLRVSAARRLVLEALLAADGPMSAEQIADGIGGRVPSSDIASVYRNLQAFEDIGLVHHVHLGHGPGLHALTVAGRREYLTCERCGDYRPLALHELDCVRGLIERQFGYRACFTHFPIVGLCVKCVAETDGDPRATDGRHSATASHRRGAATTRRTSTPSSRIAG